MEPKPNVTTPWPAARALTIRAAANVLRVREAQVHRLIQDGRLAAVEIRPRRWRIDPAAVGRLLQGDRR